MSSMYVRAKRDAITYFLLCEPSSSVSVLTAKLSVLTGVPQERQRLYMAAQHSGGGVLLDEGKTLAEQKVENDAVLGVCFQKEGGDWEKVSIEAANDHTASMHKEVMVKPETGQR